MLRVLAALGAGFDCASDAEIAAVLAAGAGPDRIIYAHPCKPPSHIRRAAAQGVSLTTFDTECELEKVRGRLCGEGGLFSSNWTGWEGGCRAALHLLRLAG